MSAKSAKPAQPELPPEHDWRTTDRDEIERRRVRAREARFRIENIDPRHPVHSTFQVESARDRRYMVEVRSAKDAEGVCECVDFRVNGLGTCKHVEAVWLHLARKVRIPFRAAQKEGSARWDIVPDRGSGTLRLAVAGGAEVPAPLRKWFGPGGRWIPGADPEAVVGGLQELTRTSLPLLRVSQEVGPWLENRGRAAERSRLRRDYEIKVQSGEWPAHETLVPLFPYQREGMLHLAFTERALLADEMGLGKTIQAVAACALLHRLGTARRVLVVTPASLKAEWEEQIRRFTRLSCHLVLGPRHKRLAFYREQQRAEGADVLPEPGGPFFIVMNYEQVVPDIAEVNDLLRPDVVVLDEAQRIKNWNTRIALTIKRLRSRFAFVLTGTPIENRIDEIRSLVDFLDPSVFGPLFRFNREFYELDDRGRPAGYCNLTRLHERIRGVLLRRRKVDVETELPPRTDRNLFVRMSEEQKMHYATHEQEVMRLANIAERRPLTKREQDRLQMELAMMRMVCDTPYILDPEDRTCPKLAEIARIFEDCRENDAKVIVFSEWERMLDLVREQCLKQGIGFAWHTGSVPQQKRRGQINAFKENPDCRVFLSTDAGATGLNLQVASVVVNCDLPWNPAKLEQRIARAWRKNQLRNVTVINLIAEGTIEQRMLDTLDTKRAVAASVLDSPGAVDRIELRSGRKAMMERVRNLVATPAGTGPSSAVGTAGFIDRRPARDREQDVRERFRQDPAAAFVRFAGERLGPALVACEERFPHGGGPAVLCLVVNGDAQANRGRLDGLRTEFLGLMGEAPPALGGGAESDLLRFEVFDQATFDAVARLAAAGLIVPTLATSRTLSLDAEPPEPPPLTAEELGRVRVRTERAQHALRRARVLGDAGFDEECRASLAEAARYAMSAKACRCRMAEPADLAATLTPPYARFWGANRDAVQAFLDRPDADWTTVAKAVGELLTAGPG